MSHLVSTFFGAFFGAFFSYLIQRDSKRSQENKSNIDGVNEVMLSILSNLEFLEKYRFSFDLNEPLYNFVSDLRFHFPYEIDVRKLIFIQQYNHLSDDEKQIIADFEFESISFKQIENCYKHISKIIFEEFQLDQNPTANRSNQVRNLIKGISLLIEETRKNTLCKKERLVKILNKIFPNDRKSLMNFYVEKQLINKKNIYKQGNYIFIEINFIYNG